MLSVITVNHNSSALLKGCLSSIASVAGSEVCEFIVIDSGSRAEDAADLRDLEDGNTSVILSSENIGYAKSVNIGIGRARGDVVLITNPDVIFNPGSIGAMLNALLTLPQCGAVGPKTWWNRGMSFMLPSSELITPSRMIRSELMRVSRAASNLVLRSWIRRNLRCWLSETPVKQEMLSGACIMTTKKTLDVVGGFDEIFPLYFEDTDWSLRVTKAGYRLYLVPQSHIVHYYNQSARQDIESSREKYRYSLDLFMRKHFRGQLFLVRQSLRLHEDLGFRSPLLYDDKGVFSSPPVIDFRESLRRLLLLSPVDSLMPSAGSFVEGKSFAIPEDLWDCLEDGRYFVKAIDIGTFRSCGAWTWVKSGPDNGH